MLHVVVIDIVDEQSVILDFRSACVETENQGFHLTKPGSIHIFNNSVCWYHNVSFNILSFK